jgi:hypothetical protein
MTCPCVPHSDRCRSICSERDFFPLNASATHLLRLSVCPFWWILRSVLQSLNLGAPAAAKSSLKLPIPLCLTQYSTHTVTAPPLQHCLPTTTQKSKKSTIPNLPEKRSQSGRRRRRGQSKLHSFLHRKSCQTKRVLEGSKEGPISRNAAEVDSPSSCYRRSSHINNSPICPRKHRKSNLHCSTSTLGTPGIPSCSRNTLPLKTSPS